MIVAKILDLHFCFQDNQAQPHHHLLLKTSPIKQTLHNLFEPIPSLQNLQQKPSNHCNSPSSLSSYSQTHPILQPHTPPSQTETISKAILTHLCIEKQHAV